MISVQSFSPFASQGYGSEWLWLIWTGFVEETLNRAFFFNVVFRQASITTNHPSFLEQTEERSISNNHKAKI